MHTHQPPAGCSLLGRTRPCRRPSGSFRAYAGTRYMHTRHRQSACLLHVQITRTRARCACTTAAHAPALSAAGVAASHPSTARSKAALRRRLPSPPRRCRRRRRPRNRRRRRRCRRTARQSRPDCRRAACSFSREKDRPSDEGRTDGPVAAGRARDRSHLPSGHVRRGGARPMGASARQARVAHDRHDVGHLPRAQGRLAVHWSGQQGLGCNEKEGRGSADQGTGRMGVRAKRTPCIQNWRSSWPMMSDGQAEVKTAKIGSIAGRQYCFPLSYFSTPPNACEGGGQGWGAEQFPEPFFASVGCEIIMMRGCPA